MVLCCTVACPDFFCHTHIYVLSCAQRQCSGGDFLLFCVVLRHGWCWACTLAGVCEHLSRVDPVVQL